MRDFLKKIVLLLLSGLVSAMRTNVFGIQRCYSKLDKCMQISSFLKCPEGAADFGDCAMLLELRTFLNFKRLENSLMCQVAAHYNSLGLFIVCAV